MTRKVDKPEFRTVVLYDEFEEFINKSKDNNKDSDKLYKEIILDTVSKDFIAQADRVIGKTIMELDELEAKLRLLKDERVEEIVEDTLEKSNRYLLGIDTTVYIFPSTLEYHQTTSMLGGIAGWTLGSGKILILVDPTAENWEYILSYIVAHEYHHSVWSAQKFDNSKFTLLDYLVFEGRADSFVNKVFPNVKAPWTSSICFETEKIVWNLISAQLNSKDDELLTKVMFGGVKDFPLWSGYTIGYHIVQDFLNNNLEVSIEEWTKMDSRKILEKSRYEGRF